MKLLLTLLCSVISLTALAQTKQEPDTAVVEFTKVQQMPEYKGGMQKFYQDISANLKYPKEAKDANIAGRVFLSFIVELDGTLSNFKIQRKLGYGCEEAAVNAIKPLKFVKPAHYNGKPARMLYNIPVKFGS